MYTLYLDFDIIDKSINPVDNKSLLQIINEIFRQNPDMQLRYDNFKENYSNLKDHQLIQSLKTNMRDKIARSPSIQKFKDAQYIVVNCYTYGEYISDALATWINCVLEHCCTNNENLSQIKKIFFMAKDASKDIGESDKKRLEAFYFSEKQSLLSIANLSIAGIPSDNIEFTKIQSIKAENLFSRQKY